MEACDQPSSDSYKDSLPYRQLTGFLGILGGDDDDLPEGPPPLFCRRKEGTSASADINAAWLFLEPKPSDLVTLKCGEKTFSFNKAILIKDSEYFSACLNPTFFIEGKTSAVDFDPQDVDPEHLGVYLHLVFSKAVGSPILEASLNTLREPMDLRALVKVYQIADRFLNSALRDDLSDLVVHVADKHTPIETDPRFRTEEGRIWWLENFKRAFEALDESSPDQMSLRTDLVHAFCRRFPGHQLRSVVHLVEDNHDFLRELLVAMAERAFMLQNAAPENQKIMRGASGSFCGRRGIYRDPTPTIDPVQYLTNHEQDRLF